ncbi:serine hydrolase [Caulobacter sp. S45]|uniref:serine hydrolase domain-containing protein n=1 Tax=Caulobacter sp. S45 TaxID=1641861 RepID=UPI001576978B|nr:serine hydrolase domain-containing protein [Caulobacter sp. S45]
MTSETLAGLSTARLERITELLNTHYVDPGRIAGCQILVARHGEVAYSRSLGLMDRERAKPWADDTVARIYSMTKPIASVALMMLWERGLFQIDEPVAKVLPEWRDLKVWVSGESEAMRTEAPHRPVSFRDLLSHTSGLTYGTLLETLGAPASRDPVIAAYKALKVRMEPDEDLDAFVAKLGRLPLRYQPGQQWMYSLATDVIGALVQRLSGKPFDVFLQEEVFNPLGMVDTGFHVRQENVDRFAACYARRADKTPVLQDDPQASPYLHPPVFLSGGGGLVSTMADYHRFCEMLRRGGKLDGERIIGPRTLAFMIRNHLAGGKSLAELSIDSFSETTPAGVGFGLGFAMTTDGVRAGTPSEGDYFWGGAASTAFWVDPVQDLVVIFLTQLLPSTSFNFRGQLRSLVYSAIVA